MRGTSARDRLGACSVRGSLWSCLVAAAADAFVDCGHLSTVGPEEEPVLEVKKGFLFYKMLLVSFSLESVLNLTTNMLTQNLKEINQRQIL